MYHFKEVILQNGPHKRKSLIIEFDDPNMRIIGEFLMADAPLLGGQVLQEIDQVLAREKTTITSNGNRCSLKIANPTSIVSDLFEGMNGVEVYPSYEIGTEELRKLLVMWFQKLKEFNKNQ